MKKKFVDAYMDVAYRFAQLSTAKRLQVGAIIVKDDRIISIVYNGMPSGWTNECEYLQHTYDSRDVQNDPTFWKDLDRGGYSRLKTKDEVIHAEANAIAKLAKGPESGLGATMFLTHSPCIQCAKQIYTSGINKVFFSEKYRDDAGINFLQKCNIDIEQWTTTL
jgi:dCMP deaminase